VPGVPYKGAVYHVPPGYVLIEWVGAFNPFDEPFVRLNLTLGKYTADQAALIRTLVNTGHRPYNDKIARRMEKHNGYHGLPGLSRDITWGPKSRAKPGDPGSFVQMVTCKDADILKSSPNWHEFQILQEEPERPKPFIIRPPCEFVYLGEQHLRSVEQITRTRW
jgi:hypothetical protein